MKTLIIILISLPCYSQIVASSTIALSDKPYYGADIRYIQDEGIQQLHYGLKVTNGFTSASISGYQGRSLKWGFGCAFTKYKENLSVSYNPLISYQKKRVFAEAGTLIRVVYYGEDRNRWNHFITLGIKLK